jgi:hypothetical protein
MSIRDKIKERLSVAPASFYVDEWDETIYCYPLSCKEMGELQSKHKSFLMDMSPEAMVDLIQKKALDKDGEKLFGIEDKTYLMREQMALISSVVARILGSQIDEDYEKN